MRQQNQGGTQFAGCDQDEMDARERRFWAYMARCARDRQRREPLAGDAYRRYLRVVEGCEAASRLRAPGTD